VNDFEGKVAVVTGAGSGMGRAFAQRSAEEGMKLVLGDIEQTALDKAVEELSAGGFDVVGVPTDVSKREAIQHLADVALERYGKLNVAFNNAGVEGFLDGALWEATQKDWEWTMGVNLWSVIYGTQIFLPLILAQDEEGYVVVTGRLKDVIIRHGENISAKEVEDLVYQHPSVADVAVVGLPDERTGERACAVVALRPDAPAFDLAGLREFLEGKGLRLQSVPEQLEIVDAVPRNPAGKILKHKLREQLLAGT